MGSADAQNWAIVLLRNVDVDAFASLLLPPETVVSWNIEGGPVILISDIVVEEFVGGPSWQRVAVLARVVANAVIIEVERLAIDRR